MRINLDLKIKRFTALLWGVLMFMLCSCTRLGSPILSNDDGQKADARLEGVIETIKNKDKDALKAMFSEQAQSEAEDLDGRINYVFEFVQGNVESWEAIVSGAVEKNNHYGNIVKKSKSWYSVKTNQQEYLFYIVEFTEDTDHPENVGLYMLQVIHMEDKDTQFLGSNTAYVGIYMPETTDDGGNVSPTDNDAANVSPP